MNRCQAVVFTFAGLSLSVAAIGGIMKALRLSHERDVMKAFTTLEHHPSAEGTALLARLPLTFVENRGQWQTPAQFLARKHGMVALFSPESITLKLERRAAKTEGIEGVVVRLVFEGASPAAQLEGEDQQSGRYNFFLGNEPDNWQTDVPGFAQVRYRNLYDGVDLRVREHEGRLEYDVLLAPGANLDQLAIRTEGVERLSIGSDGSLVMHTALGPITHKAPTTWYELPSGQRQETRATFRLLDEKRYGFEVPKRDMRLAMVIDPGLVYSTFLGGSAPDAAFAVDVDSQGAAYVTGSTGSVDFPILPIPGAFQVIKAGLIDAFVTKIDPTGTAVVWSTYLGGRSDDEASGIVADSGSGQVTVVGKTSSLNFPTFPRPGAYQTTLNRTGSPGFSDAFVTRFDPTGSSLIYSTYLGDSSNDAATALTLDASGQAFVVGWTRSTNFPTQNPYQAQLNRTGTAGFSDAFMTYLNATGTALVYSTFLGGSQDDGMTAVALNNTSGEATAVGWTKSSNFPTTQNSLQAQLNQTGTTGFADAFVTRFTQAGTGLAYSTFLGGAQNDAATAVALGRNGETTVTGTTFSSNFPVCPSTNVMCLPLSPPPLGFPTAPFQRSHGGGADAFVTRIGPTGIKITYSTFVGGRGNDAATALAHDPDSSDPAIVVGWTDSADFPICPARSNPNCYTDPNVPVSPLSAPFQSNLMGGKDGFVARMNLDAYLPQLVYSTYLGGSADDEIRALVLDARNSVKRATVVGLTSSLNFPLAPPGVVSPGGTVPPNTLPPGPIYGRLPMGYMGAVDGFVTKAEVPTIVRTYGRSSGSSTCPGPFSIGISAIPQAVPSSLPNPPVLYIGLTTSGNLPAPVLADLYLAFAPDVNGTPLRNTRITTHISYPLFPLGTINPNTAWGPYPLNIMGLRGVTVYMQFILRAPYCGSGADQYLSSNALEITFQ